MPLLNKDNKYVTVSSYFVMAILFLIVITVLYLYTSGRDVPNSLLVPFSLIISYLLGVKTPEQVTKNVGDNEPTGY